MVKRRTEIKKIEEKAKRNATFRTRRKELFKLAREFGQDFGAEVVAVTIQEASNVFAFGHPNLTSVVQNYREAKEVESSKKDDDDDQEAVQEVLDLSADDFDETEESTDDDEDESKSDLRKEVKTQGLSTADSNMIRSLWRKLLRKLHRVEDLELHELEQLLAEMEEIEKKILDRTNQIMAEMEEIEKKILDRDIGSS